MSKLAEIADPHRKSYPSDLSDAEWEIICPQLPPPEGFGHSRTIDLREILNGIFYVHRLSGAENFL
jgi:putative transposase